MKVGLVVPGFSANEHDWCIPALLDFVRLLARQAEVHVFTLRWPDRPACYEIYGAKVHAMGAGRRLGVRVVGLWARTAQAIAAEHKRGRFDVLHAFWVDEPGWVAAWAGRRLGLPVVLSLAGGELARLPDIGYGLQLLPGRNILLRWAVRQAMAVTAGSNYLCDLARKGGVAAGVRRAPLGVDVDLFAPTPNAGANRSRPKIVSIGSLVPVKDHALLLRVFGRVAAAVPGAQLTIVGDGPLLADLRAAAAGLGVRFLGTVDHGALPALCGRARVIVQTSRYEAQGLAVLEAAACGLAPLGTPVGVLPEVGRAAQGEGALAEAMIEVLRDERCREMLGAEARARVLSGFGLRACVDRFCDIYEEVSQ